MSKEHVFFGKFIIKEKDGTDEYTVSTEPLSDKERDALAGIVRCRDCEFYTPERMYREARGFGVYEDMWEPGGCFNPKRCRIIADSSDPSGEWNVVGIDTEPDGFCAWGKRKVVDE